MLFQLRRGEPSQPVVLPGWRIDDGSILGALVMAAKRIHTGRIGSPHVCVVLEPPSGVLDRTVDRSAFARAMCEPTGGYAVIVYVNITSMLLEHYNTQRCACVCEHDAAVRVLTRCCAQQGGRVWR